MARPQAFARELKVATAGLEPNAIAALLAKVARQALADAQGSGEAPSTYVRAVNGRIGAAEESVTPPGPIVYTFSWLPEVAAYALAFAKGRSPVRSGRFRDSWFAMVNGVETTELAAIPPDAELIITNNQPYARKIEVGRMKMSVPPGVAQDTRQAIMAQFGNVVSAEVRFINLAQAYTLKTSGKSRRKDRAVGAPLTYPAIVVNMRF